jgi:hypothetical protein
MKSFARRRWRNLGIVLVLAAVILVFDSVYTLSMRSFSYVSGWTLLIMILGLAAYNIRKKLPFLPLGSSATWLQIHIYAGLLTAVLFLVHFEFRIPNGVFEIVLSLLYVSVFLSGLGGLVLSRVFAMRLTSNGGEVLFERIPFFIRQIQDEVHQIVLNGIAETETSVIPDFYVTRLKPFFDRPRHFWSHLLQSRRPSQSLHMEIQAQDRYLSEPEREVMRAIEDRVWLKNRLDLQFSLQGTLKYWLFLHVPLTYALLVFAVVHLVLVYAFSGGI